MPGTRHWTYPRKCFLYRFMILYCPVDDINLVSPNLVWTEQGATVFTTSQAAALGIRWDEDGLGQTGFHPSSPVSLPVLGRSDSGTLGWSRNSRWLLLWWVTFSSHCYLEAEDRSSCNLQWLPFPTTMGQEKRMVGAGDPAKLEAGFTVCIISMES